MVSHANFIPENCHLIQAEAGLNLKQGYCVTLRTNL
jgi:hypothetical protein